MKKLLLSISALALVVAAQAQISLVHQIYPGNSSDPCMIFGMGNKVYFNANESVNGRELWGHDPATNITGLVYNIAPGATSSMTSNFNSNKSSGIVLNNKLYFGATDGTNGYELWVYDGVSAPTMIEIAPGPTNSSPMHFAVMNGKLYFSAFSATVGRELCVYDPATNIATYLTDLAPGGASCNPQLLTVFNDKIYFRGKTDATGLELFVYDPGTNTSGIVSDISTGTDDANPGGMAVINGKLYFKATTVSHGVELYSYNGIGNPIRITDIAGGTANGLFDTDNNVPTLLNDKIYFCGGTAAVGSELYALDIATNTVQLVFEFLPGNPGGTPLSIVNYANALYFSAMGPEGAELWKYDGINQPTLIMDLNPGPAGALPLLLTVIGDKLYFNATDGNVGYELFEYYDAAVSVKKVGLELNVEVFPVPATTDVHIRISSPAATSFATQVYDMTGKIVYTLPYQQYGSGTNDVQIPMQTLAAGNYQYKLTDKGGSMLATGKIVKQ